METIFLYPKKTIVVKSAFALLFVVFRNIGEYICLDLFYFVNLTSTCSVIPHRFSWS